MLQNNPSTIQNIGNILYEYGILDYLKKYEISFSIDNFIFMEIIINSSSKADLFIEKVNNLLRNNNTFKISCIKKRSGISLIKILFKE